MVLLYAFVFNPPLIGAQWTLTTIDGTPAVSAPDVEPKIRFLPFTYAGNTGCNEYWRGLFLRFGQFIKLGNAGIHEIGCAAEVMEQERQMRQALVNVRRYYRSNNALYLITADGTVLKFAR